MQIGPVGLILIPATERPAVTARKPIVLIGNNTTDLPAGDTLDPVACFGYTPARPVTAFAAGGAGLSDLSVAGSYSMAATVNFTAAAGNASISARLNVQNNSSGSGAMNVSGYVDIYDNTASAVAATGATAQTTVVAGSTGLQQLCAGVVAGNLTLGHSYTARFMVNKASTSAVVGAYNIELEGQNN